MLDSGNQRSYISSELRHKLNLPKLRTEWLLIKTFGKSQITDLSQETKDTLTYLKTLEADIFDVRTVNDRLVERVVKTFFFFSMLGKYPVFPTRHSGDYGNSKLYQCP